MQKLQMSVQIAAPAHKVWQILWSDDTYRRWTSVFQEGSHAESDWQEGSKVLFLDGKGDGMTSRIARLIPNEWMSFEHLGEIRNGQEDFSVSWAGAFENYRLNATDEGTELVVELDTNDEYAQYFQDLFPKALAVIKNLSETPDTTPITVSAQIQAPLEKVWRYWTEPAHIVNWNHASDDWHTPTAENDLRDGGHFSFRMAARDGSAAFDLKGQYEAVVPLQTIQYVMEDGRKVHIHFTVEGDYTQLSETFDPEQVHSRELQQAGWQAILDNFKKYTESTPG